MGIPSFFRWVADRYPLSVVRVKGEPWLSVNGACVPPDATAPNPNGLEFDNLYIDMNGIIHPCFHPEGFASPSSYDEVYKAVFLYIDHVFTLIRPRKLLFLAIDGVAPRAKMNQQRARRFKSAKERADAASEEQVLRKDMVVEDERSTQAGNIDLMDSNIITPGTEFMASLSQSLQYYIQLKISADPGWKNIKVILSDANVPGEGEYKIASFIRSQRNLPGYNPNTRHCLYGMDADLIMLALATHEIHISILREDRRAAPMVHKINTRGALSRDEDRMSLKEAKEFIPNIKFQFIHIWILREYLEYDMKLPRYNGSHMETDLERLIDDFVFICLFVGNDFLPRIPTIDISEGAIELLMTVYKTRFVRMGGYLTNSSEVNLERVEYFLQAIGFYESSIIRTRIKINKRFMPRQDAHQSNGTEWMEGSQDSNLVDMEPQKEGSLRGPEGKVVSSVGWKKRYYAEKLNVRGQEDQVKVARDAVLKYVEGICWFMHYYYQGICSWQWYYPYHYAPFASDFLGLKSLDIKFTLGEPFKPFDQLMSVLPASSSHALPAEYRKLMTDPSSSIIGFYPSDFQLDLNGRKFLWQAVIKLPFVEEERLLSEISKVESTLTDDEKTRNKYTMDLLFLNRSHIASSNIISYFTKRENHPKLLKSKLKKKLQPEICGLNGYIYLCKDGVNSSEIKSPIGSLENIKDNDAIFVYFKPPSCEAHVPRILTGVTLPKKTVLEQQAPVERRLWHIGVVRKPARPVHGHSNGILGKRKYSGDGNRRDII